MSRRIFHPKEEATGDVGRSTRWGKRPMRKTWWGLKCRPLCHNVPPFKAHKSWWFKGKLKKQLICPIWLWPDTGQRIKGAKGQKQYYTRGKTYFHILWGIFQEFGEILVVPVVSGLKQSYLDGRLRLLTWRISRLLKNMKQLWNLPVCVS